MSRQDDDTKAGCCCNRPKPDVVAEAGQESFPASDPPAWTSGEDREPTGEAPCCSSPPKAA